MPIRLGDQTAAPRATATAAGQEDRADAAAPVGADRPPANQILGPGAGLVDKIRDALSGRNT